MSRMTRVGLLAGATALTVTGVSVASPAVEGNDEALRAEIQRLSSRVAELEGRNNDNWMTEKRADEIRSIVHDVLADADTRASLLGSGMTSGYDPVTGFRIGSADGNYELNIQGQLQTRWVYNYRSDGGSLQGDRHRSGFENSRTKIVLGGHVINPQWSYRIEADFGSFGAGSLQDAWIGYDYGNGINIRAGQMKLPFMGENLIDSRYQQAIERSLFSTMFSGSFNPFDGTTRANRAQGIAVTFEQDMFRLTGMWSNGAGGNIGGFGLGTDNTPWTNFDTEWALTGRLEVLAAGTWGQFYQYRSEPGDPMGVMIGAAVHYQHTEYGVFGTQKIETVGLTADVNAQFGGFNLFGSIAWAHNDFKGAGSADPWGFTLQAGFHIAPPWELFLRYEWADFDTPGTDDLSILTGGVNYYFAGHQAKASLDMGYSFNSIGTGNPITGWVADAPGDDGQFVIRSQLQLLF